MSNEDKQFYPPYSQTFCHNFAASSGSTAGSGITAGLLAGGGVLGTLAYQAVVRNASIKTASETKQNVSENKDD